MKISWAGFLGENMSWSIVGQSICRELKLLGHEVDMFSTNGDSKFPDDLRQNLKPFKYVIPKNNYDCQLSYTVPHNFSKLLSNNIINNRNRFAIWNYETTVLPPGFASYVKNVDKLLPSSNFSKEVFVKNKISEDRQVVIHHGIDTKKFANKNKFPLKTNKKYKILANIAQPHLRKNIKGLFDVYGKAFTKLDDVCLVVKISKRSSQKVNKDAAFEDNFDLRFSEFKKKYPNHGDVEIVVNFIPDIVELYNACDIVFSMTHAECFWMPGLESFAANKITIAPNYGGQKDYMNYDNSFLINGSLVRAPLNYQYWIPSPYGAMFQPNIDDAIDKLRESVKNYDKYLLQFAPKMQEVASRLSWLNATKKILELMK